MNDEDLLQAWRDNASTWALLVRRGALASRIEVTNQAILEAIGMGEGRSVLDLGCGEGWLSHRLSERGWRATGVDAVGALVDASADAGPGEFLKADYDSLESALPSRQFHTIVANFSLLGERSVEAALRSARRLTTPAGRLVIQTLHPSSIAPYVDGWRTETWTGLRSSDCAPSPWYFRTLESWFALLRECGFRPLSLREPRAEGAEFPSSLLLQATPV